MKLKYNNKKTILLLAGGTGGHIFPAQAFAEYCIQNGDNIHWIGTNRGLEKQITQKYNIDFTEIKFNGLRGKSIFKFIKFPFSLLYNLIHIKTLFKRIKPDITISFGGYSTIPGGIISYLTKTPLILHEQNAKIGRANKFLSYFAKIHSSAYENVFPEKFNNTSQTIGNPLRNLFYNNQIKFNQKSNINILILGGSLGARFLNQTIPNIIKNINNNINITHQTGESGYKNTCKLYQDLYQDSQINLSNIKIIKFIDKMPDIYKQTDIIICRSGALTVSEVSAFGIPAIYIPYPIAMDNHQWHNAQPLVKQNAAYCLEEKDIKQNHKVLINLINEIINNTTKRFEMHKNAINFAMTKLNATEKLYQIAIKHLDQSDQFESELPRPES